MRVTIAAMYSLPVLLLGACDSWTATEPMAEPAAPSIEIVTFPAQYEFRAGDQGHAIIVVVLRKGGYTDSVRVSVDGVPQGVEAKLQSGGEGYSGYVANIWVTALEGAAAGVHTLTLHAAGVGVDPVTKRVELRVIPPIPFSFTSTPSRFTIKRGDKASGVIAIQRKGYNGYVSFSYRKYPGVTMTMTPTATAGDSVRFTIEVTQAADADAYIFPLTGTIAGGDSQSVLISVDVPRSGP